MPEMVEVITSTAFGTESMVRTKDVQILRVSFVTVCLSESKVSPTPTIYTHHLTQILGHDPLEFVNQITINWIRGMPTDEISRTPAHLQYTLAPSARHLTRLTPPSPPKRDATCLGGSRTCVLNISGVYEKFLMCERGRMYRKRKS